MASSNLLHRWAAAGLLFLGLCTPAQATTYALDGDVIGIPTKYEVQADENLYAIARRFDLGIVEVLAANPGIDPWAPQEGSYLTLPTMHVLPNVERRGIVINLSELRLFYFPDAKTVITFPIGIGRDGWQTPVGRTSVVGKREHPAWVPPASIREENPNLPEVVPPGPDNPLGDYALELGLTDYRIHGTNLPYGVGKRVSHGCIRLYPEDIAALFRLIKKGTPVTIIDTNFAFGWENGQLWLEVSPTQQQTDDIADYQVPPPTDIPGIHRAAAQIAGPQAMISWYVLDEAINERNGIPVVVARHSGK